MSGERKYAGVSWCAEDILSLRPAWTDEQCEDFLLMNEGVIRDMMCERGWEAIAHLLPPGGYEEECEEEVT